jgi:hypothetical protein
MTPSSHVVVVVVVVREESGRDSSRRRRWRRRRRISFTKMHAPHSVITMKFIRPKSEFIMIHNTPHSEGTKRVGRGAGEY